MEDCNTCEAVRLYLRRNKVSLGYPHYYRLKKILDFDFDELLGRIEGDFICSKCKAPIEPPRVTPGPVGSGRQVQGGFYTIPGDSKVYCRDCATELIEAKRSE